MKRFWINVYAVAAIFCCLMMALPTYVACEDKNAKVKAENVQVVNTPLPVTGAVNATVTGTVVTQPTSTTTIIRRGDDDPIERDVYVHFDETYNTSQCSQLRFSIGNLRNQSLIFVVTDSGVPPVWSSVAELISQVVLGPDDSFTTVIPTPPPSVRVHVEAGPPATLGVRFALGIYCR